MSALPLIFPGHPGVCHGDYIQQVVANSSSFTLPSSYLPLRRLIFAKTIGFQSGHKRIFGPVLQLHDDTWKDYGILSARIPIPEKDWEQITDHGAERTVWVPICQRIGGPTRAHDKTFKHFCIKVSPFALDKIKNRNEPEFSDTIEDLTTNVIGALNATSASLYFSFSSNTVLFAGAFFQILTIKHFYLKIIDFLNSVPYMCGSCHTHVRWKKWLKIMHPPMIFSCEYCDRTYFFPSKKFADLTIIESAEMPFSINDLVIMAFENFLLRGHQVLGRCNCLCCRIKRRRSSFWPTMIKQGEITVKERVIHLQTLLGRNLRDKPGLVAKISQALIAMHILGYSVNSFASKKNFPVGGARLYWKFVNQLPFHTIPDRIAVDCMDKNNSDFFICRCCDKYTWPANPKRWHLAGLCSRCAYAWADQSLDTDFFDATLENLVRRYSGPEFLICLSCSQKAAKKVSQHTFNHLLVCHSCDSITVINQHLENFDDDTSSGLVTTFSATEVSLHFNMEEPIDGSD
jgi:hypothetical protein